MTSMISSASSVPTISSSEEELSILRWNWGEAGIQASLFLAAR